MNAFANAIAAAAEASPMGNGTVPIVPNRILLVDGDGLAYYCAGNDTTNAGEARARLLDKVKGAARQVGAEHIRLLLTASGSNKGHRYAIARVKPYQGQRTNSHRPKNWGALREYMEDGNIGHGIEVESTVTAEADDLFGYYAYSQPQNVVIYTQDKDMRMLPGNHLDWVEHRMRNVPYTGVPLLPTPPAYPVVSQDCVHNDKQYGPKWFWLQMLHGDTADNIPGLPKYKVRDGVLKPVGEVTAGKLLDYPRITESLAQEVALYYHGYYGDRWLVEMMEQACLLWMRRVPARWDDCMNPGGPLACFNDGSTEFARAFLEIEQRVRDADTYNQA